MTREQQLQIREAKQAAKIAAREAKKQERIELRNWDKAVARWKGKDAWIETVFAR